MNAGSSRGVSLSSSVSWALSICFVFENMFLLLVHGILVFDRCELQDSPDDAVE